MRGFLGQTARKYTGYCPNIEQLGTDCKEIHGQLSQHGPNIEKLSRKQRIQISFLPKRRCATLALIHLHKKPALSK
ncbi:hypothetical protein D1B31_11700 [Neobacillus notoginsengisoli]|uniref:Uncharacterized protein n=1 Tax=Neobacillus notoginsengisoli TaxID=1578198 RepID=A0A417YT35_9BACI|nr:hypothetical protein D1B31_11700 [Neobacillus notoginsengisoli]